MRITWGEFRPRITNPNDGLALKLMIWNSLVLHPAAIHKAILSVVPNQAAERRTCLLFIQISYIVLLLELINLKIHHKFYF